MAEYLPITYNHPFVNFTSFVDYLEYLMHYNIFVLFLLYFTTALATKWLQLRLTLCDPIYGNPSGSPIPGILQGRILEWVSISFSNALKWKMKVKLLSRVRFLAIPWTVAYQAPPSIGFSRQEYWSGVTLPSPTMALKDHYLESFLDLTQLQVSWCYKHLELEDLNQSMFTDYPHPAPSATEINKK